MRGESGFGLLELVAALTLLAFITLGLTSSLRLGVQMLTRVTGDHENQTQLYASQQAVRRFVEIARPLHVDETQPELGVVFSGRRDELRFVTELPTAFGLGGDYSVAFLVKVRPSGQKDLVLIPEIYPSIETTQTPRRQTETIVIADIESASWSYFGPQTAGGQSAWTDTWERRPTLPSLVALDVKFPADSVLAWPRLYMSPRLR